MFNLFSSFDFSWWGPLFWLLPLSLYFTGSETPLKGASFSPILVGSGGLHSFLGGSRNTNSLVFSFYLTVIFIFLAGMNFFSGFPFIFCSTSHISLTFSLGFFSWFFLVLMSLQDWRGLVSHLVPESSPVALGFFLVYIEFLGKLIRPLTLALRLMSNMTAGHLIMSLIFLTSGSLFTFVELVKVGSSSVIYIMEVGISFIQAMIFCLLLSLFLNS